MKFKNNGRERDAMVFAILGQINEVAEDACRELLDQVSTKSVIFDLAGMTHINSIGIRYWLSFLKSLDQRCEYVFRNCPRVFVDSAVLCGVLGKGKIESFEIPFFCEACDDAVFQMGSMADVQDQSRLKEKKCPTCKGGLSFDLDFDEYVEGLKSLGF